jgi:hypothetical protein
MIVRTRDRGTNLTGVVKILIYDYTKDVTRFGTYLTIRKKKRGKEGLHTGKNLSLNSVEQFKITLSLF